MLHVYNFRWETDSLQSDEHSILCNDDELLQLPRETAQLSQLAAAGVQFSVRASASESTGKQNFQILGCAASIAVVAVVLIALSQVKF